MKKKNQATVGLIAAIILLACACPVSGLPSLGVEATPYPTIPPIAPSTEAVIPSPTTEISPSENIPSGNVLYSDDFSTTSAELEDYSGDGGSAGTENGVYVIRSTADLWQWGKSQSEFEDVVIDVDATMISGPSNNNIGFGVFCRLTETEDGSVDGYMLAISGDGYYTIRVIVESNMSPLVDWTSSDVVNQGNVTNHIHATCNGSDLSLEVNGQVVATAVADPSAPTVGAIAFSAISFETDSRYAEVNFDNLVVSQP